MGLKQDMDLFDTIRKVFPDASNRTNEQIGNDIRSMTEDQLNDIFTKIAGKLKSEMEEAEGSEQEASSTQPSVDEDPLADMPMEQKIAAFAAMSDADSLAYSHNFPEQVADIVAVQEAQREAVLEEDAAPAEAKPTAAPETKPAAAPAFHDYTDVLDEKASATAPSDQPKAKPADHVLTNNGVINPSDCLSDEDFQKTLATMNEAVASGASTQAAQPPVAGQAKADTRPAPLYFAPLTEATPPSAVAIPLGLIPANPAIPFIGVNQPTQAPAPQTAQAPVKAEHRLNAVRVWDDE